MKIKRSRKPVDWQKDPNNIYSDRVQFWRNGVMITVMDKAQAASLVTSGNAFVMCEQAIGALDEKGEFDS